MNFSRYKLTEFRKKKRWSISDLAKETDISRKAISYWEKGLVTPKKENLLKICHALELAPSDLCKNIVNEKHCLNQKVDFSEAITKAMNIAVNHNSISNAFEIIQTLNRNLEKYSSIIHTINNALGVGLYIKDIKNRYIYANQFFHNLINYTDKTVFNLTDDDLLPKNFAQINKESDYSVLHNNEYVKNHKIKLKINSKYKICVFNKNPILNAQQNIIGLICCVLDITNECEAEKYKAIINSLVQNVNNGVWVAEYANILKPVLINNYLANGLGISNKRIIKDHNLFSSCLNLSSIDINSITASSVREYETYNSKSECKIKVKEKILKIDKFLIGISTFKHQVESYRFNK